MRNATLIAIAIAISALAFPAAIAFAASDPYAQAASVQAGAPDTPSGEGDPAAIVCRAPQTLPGGGLGPKICLHNNVWAKLTETGKDLSADGKSVMDRPVVGEPSGEGNPDAITCRRPQQVQTGWRLTEPGPEICLTNAYWAKLRAGHKRIAEDGHSIIDASVMAQPLPGPLSFGSPETSMLPARQLH